MIKIIRDFLIAVSCIVFLYYTWSAENMGVVVAHVVKAYNAEMAK